MSVRRLAHSVTVCALCTGALLFNSNRSSCQTPPPAPNAGAPAGDGTPAPKKTTAPATTDTPEKASPQEHTPPAAPAGNVIAPGATVSTPQASSANNPGLIVAAPGSTVVIQQLPGASNAAPKSPGGGGGGAKGPNSFAQTDLSIVSSLINTAKNFTKDGKKADYSPFVRAGAIDALGTIGSSDPITENQIVNGLVDVLNIEFINNQMRFLDKNGPSSFLCYKAVQALGKRGWDSRGAIALVQLLRGNDVILDQAIDEAIKDIQAGATSTKPAVDKAAEPKGSDPAGKMGDPMGNGDSL